MNAAFLTCVPWLVFAAPAMAAPKAWTDRTASPDTRAEALVAAMTQDEKLQLVATDMPIFLKPRPADAVVGAGYAAGIRRLGIPPIRETDASLGVANLFNMRHNDVATALPSTLALAAAWDPVVAEQAGAMIGAEARAKGFNVMLAGGANLTRDPRGGRTFEYEGEDPLLAGLTAGAEVRGIQSNGIVSTVKHFALNDQETGRQILDARIGAAAARESDLLAFEIEIEQGRPFAVMTAYNRVNGLWASENPWLLTDVLKHDWHFSGWVMSDWGNVHSTQDAANAGLDQESGQTLDAQPYFGAPLAAALRSGKVAPARLDDMVRRILRGLIAAGAYDRPAEPGGGIDYAAHAKVAQRAEERGIVLLKNENGLLPLPPDTPSMAIIGGHADIGVLSGGGSTDVRPVDGPAMAHDKGGGMFGPAWYDPSAPLTALRAEFPRATITFDDGSDPVRAAAAAMHARVVVLFAEQYRTEGADVAGLALPNRQDALIEAVAAANRHVVVVLETGGAVAMPWLPQAGAVIEAWFAGQCGGAAIARVISGAVDPAGRLPLTFPANEQQLPRTTLDGRAPLQAQTGAAMEAGKLAPFSVDYDIDGANVGYRWYAARHFTPRFPFGFGLTYTHFTYGGLRLAGGSTVTATVTVRNAGSRAGIAVPQIYALVPGAGSTVPHLIGWQSVALKAGQTKSVTIKADPRLLAVFDAAQGKWLVPAGNMVIFAGENVADQALKAEAMVSGAALPP